MRWELREQSKQLFAYLRYESSFFLRISILLNRIRSGNSKSSQTTHAGHPSDLRFPIRSGSVARTLRLYSGEYEDFCSGSRRRHSTWSYRTGDMEAALSGAAGAAQDNGESPRQPGLLLVPYSCEVFI